ncbi:MAG: hypothetical protein IKL73_07100 [Lachnospiraceae bacterium]|nr:hypothetical protein [Lachnospira sp.]MBR6698009.1 hypothetical protein [Lachnospiraceae bacterium]
MDYQQYNDLNEIQTEPKAGTGMAVASLVLGIISMTIGLCLGLSCCPFLNVIFCVLAIIFAVVSRVQRGSFCGMSLTGLILGILPLIITLAFWILMFAGVIAETSSYSDYQNMI